MTLRFFSKKSIEQIINLHTPNLLSEYKKGEKEEIVLRKKQYPKGTVVELVEMDDPQAPPVGTKGVVESVDDTGTIFVHWDNGSGLGLVMGEDNFQLVTK